MSEAWGTLLIKAPDGILPILGDDDEGYSWDDLSTLAGHAGINSLENAHPMLEFVAGTEFMFEEVPTTKSGFVEIAIFGEEWMWLASALVEKGANIELYGAIQHEHNFRELYALDAGGIRFFRNIDGEGATNEDAADQMKKDWLAAIPGDVLKTFPDAFELDEDNDD